MQIYIDGTFYSKEDAKVSVFDHGLLYGDGIFEGIRIYNGSVFKLKEHVDRLYLSAKAMLLDIGITPAEMEQVVLDTVKRNDKQNGYIRLVVTRGSGDLGMNPYLCKKASIIVIVGDIQLYPQEMYDNGIKIVTVATRRVSPQSFDPRIKSLNYLNNVLAKIEAIQAGCLEAVMLNKDGFVVECTGDNLFVIKDSVIKTPTASLGALDGITKNTVLELAAQRGLTTLEAFMTTYDLYTADECFLSGTGAELIPVIGVDGRMIGDGKPGTVFRQLLNDYKQLVKN